MPGGMSWRGINSTLAGSDAPLAMFIKQFEGVKWLGSAELVSGLGTAGPRRLMAYMRCRCDELVHLPANKPHLAFINKHLQGAQRQPASVGAAAAHCYPVLVCHACHAASALRSSRCRPPPAAPCCARPHAPARLHACMMRCAVQALLMLCNDQYSGWHVDTAACAAFSSWQAGFLDRPPALLHRSLPALMLGLLCLPVQPPACLSLPSRCCAKQPLQPTPCLLLPTSHATGGGSSSGSSRSGGSSSNRSDGSSSGSSSSSVAACSGSCARYRPACC